MDCPYGILVQNFYVSIEIKKVSIILLNVLLYFGRYTTKVGENKNPLAIFYHLHTIGDAWLQMIYHNSWSN